MLQGLLHLPAVYNEFVDDDVHPTCELTAGECIACAFKDLVHKYWTARSLTNFPQDREGGALSTLDTAVNDLCPAGSQFSDFANPHVQGDAFEFFEYLVAQIKDRDNDL